MKAETDFDFFYKKSSGNTIEGNKTLDNPKKEVEKGWAIIQALIFSIAIGAGIARYMGADNMYVFIAVVIGYMGGNALLNNLYDITSKQAVIMTVLGVALAYGLSFISFGPILAPFAGLFVVTGFTVLMRKLPNAMLLWLSKGK